MDEVMRDQTIVSLLSVGHYWIGEENPHASLCVYRWLSALDSGKEVKRKLEQFYKGWKASFPKADEKSLGATIPPIPDYCNDEEKKFRFVAANIIMNMLAVGAYEMGFLHLMEIQQGYSVLYPTVIDMIKKSDMRNEIVKWLMLHTMIAFDIAGAEEIDELGYKLIKK